MKKYISKIIIFSIGIILIYCTKSYCVESGTVRMQINGGTTWTNISVSESYAECESLNSAASTLGTTMLKAHLTTDADWSAMAIFSVSQYGGATTNSPSQTNGNNSGIYGVGTKSQTTGILNTATADSTLYISGLFNEDGTTKNYIRQWDATDREGTNFVGFRQADGTLGWLGSGIYWDTKANYPCSIKRGLFGVYMGFTSSAFNTSGSPGSDLTFRPVIWN